jgi:quercetin dioxygenase-like cupin family protein
MSDRETFGAEAAEGLYHAEERITVAEVPGLRVRQLTLAAGQCVPWHHHTLITDTFFCMKGPMEVHVRAPDCIHVLQAGGTFPVPPGQPHFVSSVKQGSCRFMIVQGVGTYDYVPEAD